MTAMFLTAPILPGKVEAWRRFCQEMRGRRQEGYEQSRRQLGIASEAVWLLRTARADVAIVRVNAEEPEHLLSRLAASDHPFDRWFKDQLTEICGVDLSPTFMGPTMELVFTWQQSQE